MIDKKIINDVIIDRIKELDPKDFTKVVPVDIHNQYAKVIMMLVEKQIKEENPNVEPYEFVIEIQEKYNDLVCTYFNIKKPSTTSSNVARGS